MTRIVANDLDKVELSSLVEFIASRLQNGFVQHGSVIDIEVSGPKDTKLLVHKFLHSNGLNDYRVLSHEGVLEIVRLKQEEHRVERPEGLKPSMPGPIAPFPRTVKPSDMVEWSTHPWEKKSRKK